MSRFAPYDFNVAANGQQVLDVVGRYVHLKSLTGATSVKVTLQPLEFTDQELEVGDDLFSDDGEQFTRVVIEETSGSAVSGTLYVGAGGRKDKKSVVGKVTLVDSDFLRLRTEAGQEFWGSLLEGAGAGVYSHVQLLNPAGAVKSVAVRRLLGSANGAATLSLRRYDTALSSDDGHLVNKLLGGATSGAEKRSEQNASLLGSEISRRVIQNAWDERDFIGDSPPILGPGEGLIIVPTTVNVSGLFFAEVSEVD